MDQKALQELKARCMTAAAQGFSIARATYYAAELQGMVGTPDVSGIALDSPEYLLILIGMAEKGEKAPAAKAPPKAEAKVEVKAEAKVEADVEIEVEEASVEVEEASVKAEEAPVKAEEPATKKKSKKN
jgi:hypothetical protein